MHGNDDAEEDEDDYWDYRRARRVFDDELEFIDEDEEEVHYRPYDWM